MQALEQHGGVKFLSYKGSPIDGRDIEDGHHENTLTLLLHSLPRPVQCSMFVSSSINKKTFLRSCSMFISSSINKKTSLRRQLPTTTRHGRCGFCRSGAAPSV